MKNVSSAFKQAMEKGSPILCYASIVLTTGKKLEIGPEDDFMLEGNSITDAAGDQGFPLGCAIAKSIKITLDNSDGRYSEDDFFYAQITFWTGIELSNGTTEKIKEGIFVVTEAVTPGEILTINAVDYMYKTDSEYVPSETSTNLQNLLNDVCRQCDLVVGSPVFANMDYQVVSIPTGCTCRTIIGNIAQIAGGNAYCDANGRLVIKSYDLSVHESVGYIDARHYEEDVEAEISGGDFRDTISAEISGGNFGENENFHNLSEWVSLSVATDDVVITGLTTTIEHNDKEDEIYIVGTEGYTLDIDNQLITGNEKNAINRIAAILVGITFRPFSGEYAISYPLSESMDPCIIWDKDDNMYPSFLTDIDFVYAGTTTLENKSDTPLKNQGTYYSQATEVYRKARQEAKRQRTEWEKAIEDLSNRLENSSGLYTTIEKDSAGGSIYYLHDKPTLAESSIVWKMTAEAFGVSTNGGKDWNAGLTVDGDVIARILYTIGVNANWIRTGSMVADFIKGGTLTLGGQNNTNGVMRILDNSGTQIGRWDKDGITASKGTFRGAVYAESGEFTGKVTATNGSFTGTVNANNGKIGGWDISQTRITTAKDIAIGENKAGVFLINEDGKPFISAQNNNKITFQITREGNAIFSGALQAATGDFSGSVTADSGKIGDWQISNGNITNGLPYTGQENSNATGMGTYGTDWAFWAGNGRFTVKQNGQLRAKEAEINGMVNASSGTFNNVTIAGSNINSSSLSGSAGNISGGNYSNPYMSGGTLASVGGSYIGTVSGGTVNNCTLGNTSLTTGNGNAYVSNNGGGNLFLYGEKGAYLYGSNVYLSGTTSIAGKTNINGGLTVIGTKNRLIKTNHYGQRLLDAYETPTPTFADYGVGRIDNEGECYIVIDPIFAETIGKQNPVIFLTKYGQGELWVDSKETCHDILHICGTPGLNFAWEARYQQANSWPERLRQHNPEEFKLPERAYEEENLVYIEHQTTDILTMAQEYIEEINRSALDYGAEGAWEYCTFNVSARNYENEGYNYFTEYINSLS